MSQPSPADSFLSGDTPPSTSARALQALWWAARGSWDRAHSLVQHDGTEDAAWVHARLHRVEGDLENASYWTEKPDAPFRGMRWKRNVPALQPSYFNAQPGLLKRRRSVLSGVRREAASAPVAGFSPPR